MWGRGGGGGRRRRGGGRGRGAERGGGNLFKIYTDGAQGLTADSVVLSIYLQESVLRKGS